jgi:17beta-estradiol 17-dehydrogenase / very-long-chain 3-oxoacyl-CoA reductase
MSEAFIIDLINMNYFMTFLFIVGLFNIQKKVFTLLRTLYYMVRSSPDLKIYGERSWAVVTGASDGIGQGFCE